MPFWETQLAAALGGAALTLLGALVAAYLTNRQADRERESRERQATQDRLNSERLRVYAKVSQAMDDLAPFLYDPSRRRQDQYKANVRGFQDAAREARLICSQDLHDDLSALIRALRAYAAETMGDTSAHDAAVDTAKRVRSGMRRDLGVPETDQPA